MTSDQIRTLQTQLNQQGANLKVDGILGPLTAAAIQMNLTKNNSEIQNHPQIAPLIAQGISPEQITRASETGDYTGFTNPVTGKPFSSEDQAAATAKAQAALQPGFDETQRYDESTAANSLKDKVNTYNEFLKTQGASFQQDKENLDQNAANNGVLFSGSRIQKEKNLKNTYDQAQQEKAASVGSDISKLGSDFQYKYGDEAAAKPTLSQYYQLGGNSFNPKVATGGVTSGAISSIYKPSSSVYQGTEINKNKAAVQVRAASLLGNKANKLVPYGYKNQF